MPAPKVRQKWRPTLALIVHAVLLAVLALPIAIVIWFRAMESTSDHMAPAEAGALVFALALTLMVAYVLTRTITGPIDALILRAEEIAKGGKSAIRPLESYGTREIAKLSQSFLDLASQLVDRSEYVRSFAAHVSHELKSPLTAIRGAAELLRDEDTEGPMTAAQRQRFLDNIVADAERLDRLLTRLRELADAEVPMTTGRTNIADVASELVRRFPALEIAGQGDKETMIALPLEALGIAIGSLAENSLQHGATRLELSASADERTMTIIVRDNGSGIPEGNRDLVFRPFFSTRRENGGTGMGLDIARAMLASHGGTIRLGSDSDGEIGGGARFEIVVPVVG